jgi:sugar O-acyltransferase (sialic acid O-acetyltransferase NeuD family)
MTGLLPLVLVGCGGHASDVLSVVEACNEAEPRYRVVGYIDDDREADDRRLQDRNVPRLGAVAEAERAQGLFVLGIGYPEQRARVAERLRGVGELAAAVVHPGASVATKAVLGRGVVVFGGAHIGPLARVCEGAMVGRGAIVGHDTLLSDHVSVMPGAVLSGDCTVGVGALIGANATVLEGRSIGDWSRLGAGAVLTQDLPAGCTAVGIPARVVAPRP